MSSKEDTPDERPWLSYMSNIPASGVLAILTRYMKGLGWVTLVLFCFLLPVVLLLHEGVPVLVPVLSPSLVDLGMTSETAEFVASVAIHVGFATLLLAYFSYVVRSRYYDPIPKWTYYTFPMYMWAKEYVDYHQLGGDGAEQWPETPPSRSDMVMAFGLGIVVLTVGLVLIGAPVVGLALAIGTHAVARHWGVRPVRPLSWHLALTPLLVSVATVLLTTLLYIDGAFAWYDTVSDLFLGLFTDSQLPFVALPIFALALVVTHVVVTYVGMYYLLIAVDSWRVRSGSLPMAEESSPPA